MTKIGIGIVSALLLVSAFFTWVMFRPATSKDNVHRNEMSTTNSFAAMDFPTNTPTGQLPAISGPAAVSALNAGTAPLANASTNAALTPVPPAAATVPILMYHYIRACTDPADTGCPSLSVTPEQFALQLLWLKNHGYVTVNPDYLVQPYAAAGKPVIITFDDGYQDVFDNAVAQLLHNGFRATFYLIVDKIGQPGYLSWSEVEVIDRLGMNIGSHTLTHADLRAVDERRLHDEIVESEVRLEQRLGHAVSDFCYPYGGYTQQVEQAVRQSGYATSVTTKQGIAGPEYGLFELPRLRMRNGSDLARLLAPGAPTVNTASPVR